MTPNKKNLLDKIIFFFRERKLRHFRFDSENFKDKEFEMFWVGSQLGFCLLLVLVL